MKDAQLASTVTRRIIMADNRDRHIAGARVTDLEAAINGCNHASQILNNRQEIGADGRIHGGPLGTISDNRTHAERYGELIGQKLAEAHADNSPVELPILGSYTKRNGAFGSSWRATFCRHLYITAPVSADYSLVLIGYNEAEANRCAQNHARSHGHAFIALSEE
jgi:hypothetical protein